MHFVQWFSEQLEVEDGDRQEEEIEGEVESRRTHYVDDHGRSGFEPWNVKSETITTVKQSQL